MHEVETSARHAQRHRDTGSLLVAIRGIGDACTGDRDPDLRTGLDQVVGVVDREFDAGRGGHDEVVDRVRVARVDGNVRDRRGAGAGRQEAGLVTVLDGIDVGDVFDNAGGRILQRVRGRKREGTGVPDRHVVLVGAVDVTGTEGHSGRGGLESDEHGGDEGEQGCQRHQVGALARECSNHCLPFHLGCSRLRGNDWASDSRCRTRCAPDPVGGAFCRRWRLLVPALEPARAPPAHQVSPRWAGGSAQLSIFHAVIILHGTLGMQGSWVSRGSNFALG